EDRRAEPQLVNQPQRREAQELRRIRHRIELPVGVKTGPRFHPLNFLIESDLTQQVAQAEIREQRDVVMPIPGHSLAAVSLKLPGAGESAQVIRALKHS